MYGQGNHGPQFGQGLQRPMPPYQQRPTGHPSQQPGPTFQVPPRPSGYPQPPPFPQNIGQQAPPISMPNTANSFMRPPPNLHHGPPFQPPYPGAQQNYGPGMQNPNHALSLPPPPPPSSLCPPRAPQPPPPAHGQVVYGAHNTPQGIPDMPLQPPMRLGAATAFRPSNFEPAKQPMYSESQIPSMAPPPPPPPPFPVASPAMPPPPPSSSSPPKPSPPASPSSANAVAGTSLQSGNGPSSASDVTTHLNSRDDMPASDEHLLPSQNVVVDLPPPPPKPEDETIVRNIDVLCKYIAKNGPDFEDTARQNGSGKPEFVFLFGGEPGSQASCAREYYLWMKKKYGLVRDGDLSQGLVGAEPSENLNSVPAEGTAHSPVDSDVDMEDDITQSEKELGVYNFAEDIKPNSVSTGDMHEMRKQINDMQLSIDSSPNLNLSQMPEQPIEPEQSVQMNTVDSPIKLIQNYSSDSSSDDNDEDLTCNEASKTKVESPPCELQPTTSHSDMVNDDITPEFGQVTEPGVDNSAPAYNESMSKKEIDNFETVECGAQDKAYEIPSQEISASSPSAAVQGNYGLENSADYSYERGSSIGGANLTCKETVKEKENKKTSTKSKVDEFGRLVKEGSSESESDDSYLVRRHKRGRSRSRSPSPSDRRRRRSPRRSPRRRKDRRSRSPRRSRSRSRSPYRHADRVGYEKTRQDKTQMPQCFDFLKGRCYRGASCRYLHHEADKNESSRPYKRKQHQPEAMVSSRNSGLDGGDGSSVKDEKHDAGGWASKSNFERNKDVCIHDTVEKGDETSVADGKKGDASTVEGSQFEEVSDKLMHHENTNFFDMPSTNDHENNHLEPEASAQPNHRLDGEAPRTDGESKVDSSTIQTHAVTSHEVHVSVSEPYAGNLSHMSAVAGDLTSQPLMPHIPPPHLLQQAANAPQGAEPVDDKSMVPAVGFAPQPAHAGNVSAYPAPLSNQQSQYLTPPNSVWGIMPPMQPPPLYMSEPSMPGPPLHFPQFQQGSVRSHAMELPSHSQIGGFQHQPYNLHLNNLPTQLFGGASLVSDHLDRDPSRFAGIGGSKIAAHYNPYASTFDQPLNTRFTSTFTQARDGVAGSNYGGSVGQTSGDGGLNKLVLSPNSSKARGKSLPQSGGHQYDPLFDSIEPSAEPFEKHVHTRDHAGDNSNKLNMLSSHYKVLDVEEKKQNEIGGVAVTMSLENDEFGETADAEVGAVENGSPSEADEDAIVAEGKTKKSKDSRSMKLFKIAVANFVKEVLKPQWRQGNMSKEVFKTIVKKTVDKVSGAMKNHRIPKSQEKIDHYIDSSRRKLTQLVEGYVSKYKS